MKKFRNLRADEIDCRVSQIDEKWCSLLLYKDARCDMNILDETVGPENWQREHKELKENIYCGVSIYDNKLEKWTTKWDVGKESNTESEKGEASDSFKRACVNWGIGRELYSAPTIFVYPREDMIRQGKTGEFYKNAKGKYETKTKFIVSNIDYDQNGNIVTLAIKDDNNNIRYQYKKDIVKVESKIKSLATRDQINRIKNLYSEEEQIKALALVKKKNLEELTVVEASQLISKRKEDK